MVTKEEYSLLAAAVYNDARGKSNQLDITPLGWSVISHEGGADGGILSSGLSINAYQKGSEIVISCKGTDFLIGSNNSQTASDLLADVGLGGGLGLGSTQLFQAALFYQKVKAQNPNAVITFTGHSLGAGLASVLSVWFNKPATVFANAPFEATALNPLVMGYLSGYLALNGYSDPEFVTFVNSYIFTYGARESQVTSYYVEGEVLNSWLGYLPFVVGTNTPIHIGGGDQLSALTLHSIVLHSSLLISQQFREDTLAVPNLLARIFDTHLYAFKLESPDQDFLTKLLKAQIVDGDISTGILSSFATDMQKLGTTVAGLSVAAQNAIIAQGIEWYYWQSNNYGGQEFFTQSGNLLQYTTAQGAGLDGALNKANLYTGAWLATLNSAYGLAYMPIIKTDYQQWNINGGVNAVTATAKNIDKTQIFIGQAGSDTFTGGNRDDVFFAGGGADTLDGGLGVFNCKNNRKHYKKHSTLGIKYAGYRQKWHSKTLNICQSVNLPIQ
jgi:Lipase (class 3)/RTX calcium-binding nonapeptide repeat (4 copies)